MEKKRIGLVAGPCSAENRSQMLETAWGLKALGVQMFRAGLWKPRSRWGSFEGVGAKGLPWMTEIQRELGLKVMTEVALPRHVEAVLKSGIDMVWIGARTTANPFMMSWAMTKDFDGGYASLEDYFDAIYLSFRIGVMKPNPKFFQVVLDNEDILPEESLFVDDGARNVEAASKLGFNIMCPVNGEDWTDDLYSLINNKML